MSTSNTYGKQARVLGKFSNVSIGINDYSKFENTMNFYEVISALNKTTENDRVSNSFIYWCRELLSILPCCSTRSVYYPCFQMITVGIRPEYTIAVGSSIHGYM